MQTFTKILEELKTKLKSQYPDTYRDFSESSNGMMLLELFSALGSFLTQNIDHGVSESLLPTAQNIDNVKKILANIGYKFRPTYAARGKVLLSFKLPRLLDGDVNLKYGVIVLPGTKFLAENGETYSLINMVDFSQGSEVGVVSDYNNLTEGQWTIIDKEDDRATIGKVGWVSGGDIKAIDVEIGEFAENREVVIEDIGIFEIVSVVDTDNFKWREVDYLSEDIVIKENLDIQYVPRRFVVDYLNDGATLKFGSGKIDTETVNGFDYFFKQANLTQQLNPKKFINSIGTGLSPYNTTLKITYKNCPNGGELTNLMATNSLNKIVDLNAFLKDFAAIDYDIYKSVMDSARVTNFSPVVGGRDITTVGQIRELASYEFASQKRTITKEDYIARIFTMPSGFGQAYKANVKVEDNKIKIYILLQDKDKKLVKPTAEYKESILGYLNNFKPITDEVEIWDGEIYNIIVDFGIKINKEFIDNKNIVLGQCLIEISNLLSTANAAMGNNIIKSRIISKLQGIAGVLSVSYVKITLNAVSPDKVSVEPVDGIIYGNENGMFEIKNITGDIRGTVIW